MKKTPLHARKGGRVNEEITVVCLLYGGPTHRIAVEGSVYAFEAHPRIGPVPLTKRGNERHLGPRHPFWRAVSWWYSQGQRIGDDGLAVWERPPGIRARRVGKHTFVADPAGDVEIHLDDFVTRRGERVDA